MTKEQIAKLEALPKTLCAVCKTSRSYTNPMLRCFSCKKKVCYDHGTASYELKGHKKGEEQKNVCLSCYEKLKTAPR